MLGDCIAPVGVYGSCICISLGDCISPVGGPAGAENDIGPEGGGRELGTARHGSGIG